MDFFHSLPSNERNEIEARLDSPIKEEELAAWILDGKNSFNNYQRHVYGNRLQGLPTCMEGK